MCDFLGQCPLGYRVASAFPHANAAAAWTRGGAVLSWLHWWWGWAVTRTEELAAFYSYRSNWKFVKPMLGAFWYAHDLVEHAGAELYFRLRPALAPPLEFVPLQAGGDSIRS